MNPKEELLQRLQDKHQNDVTQIMQEINEVLSNKRHSTADVIGALHGILYSLYNQYGLKDLADIQSTQAASVLSSIIQYEAKNITESN